MRYGNNHDIIRITDPRRYAVARYRASLRRGSADTGPSGSVSRSSRSAVGGRPGGRGVPATVRLAPSGRSAKAAATRGPRQPRRPAPARPRAPRSSRVDRGAPHSHPHGARPVEGRSCGAAGGRVRRAAGVRSLNPSPFRRRLSATRRRAPPPTRVRLRIRTSVLRCTTY